MPEPFPQSPPIPQISCGKSSPTKNTHWIIWGSHWKVIWKRFPPLFLLTGSKCSQALLNLIRNSCEAIDHPKGRITACLRKNDNGICISISDNGCGMTQDQLQHVWTPFVTYKPEGTGLGLAVVQEIVLAHHGHITLTSTPGQGSAFHIFLDDTEVLPV